MSESTPVIGIDVTAALSQKAGIGRYTRELVSSLCRYDRQPEYILFSAKQPSWDLLARKLPREAKVRFKQSLLSERWLYRIWYRLGIPLPVQSFTGEIDLYYSPDFVLPPVSGNIPTILTVHDLSFVRYPETFTPSLRSYLARVVPRSIEKASHILADSVATKNDLMEIWQVDEAKISVIYPGVNRSFRPPADRSMEVGLRQKYDIGDGPYLLTVGTIQPRKNFSLLIRSFARIVQDYPHNLLIAGGKGWLSEEVFEEVEKQELQGRVKILGFVDDDDLPTLYSEATVFLFPSLYEGFGIPILEAMACGAPVIASDASSMPEVVGEAGILLPPENEYLWATGIRDLLEDPGRRTQMVAEGFLRVRQFSWKQAAEQLSGILRRLLP